MKRITLPLVATFDEWRNEARACLTAGLPPGDVLWGDQHPSANDLFEALQMHRAKPLADVRVPGAFVDMAQIAILHNDPARYALLYRVLWRLVHDNARLMHLTTDDDIIKLQAMVKNVRRDAYKIKAFLRFREIDDHSGTPAFIAWYEPEHYSLTLSLPFFQERFKNMHWSILTPHLGAHWDGAALTLTDNPDPSQVPTDDRIEHYWFTYYASIFNPARLKTKAMMAQMPKKYWKNMPETVLINDMIKNSGNRVSDMIAKTASAD